MIEIRTLLAGLWTLPLWGIGVYWILAHDPVHCVRRRIGLLVWLALLVTYLASSIPTRYDFFLLEWFPARGIAFGCSGLERTLLFGGIFLLLGIWRPRWRKPLLLGTLLLVQLTATITLWYASDGGQPLYRTDHPSFFYRFWSWSQVAPRCIYYDPFWNGGSVIAALVASGIQAPGYALLPLWLLLETRIVYTPAIALLFLWIVPGVAALSVRLVSRNTLASIIAAFLSLGTSYFTMIHLLTYGTFGSLFSSLFLLPTSACLYRLLIQQRRDRRTWLILLVSMAFVLCWPPAALMTVPFAGLLLVNAKRLTRSLVLRGLCIAAALAAVHALPLLSLWTNAKIGGFMRTTDRPIDGGMFLAGLTLMGELLRRTHPALWFAGSLALLALPYRRYRRFFIPFIAISLLLAAFGKEWKPTLQMDRVWINALYVIILPAALVAGSLMRRRGLPERLAAALLAGLILTGGFAMVNYMGNQSNARFNTMSGEMQRMSAWLRENVPDGGRVLFAGAAVHGFGGGKVAALPIYTGREMMACDYYGFSPKLVEYNYPPREFRHQGPEKMFQFLEFYNVTHIATYHKGWKETLQKVPQYYEMAWRSGEKMVFRVRRDNTMFIEGGGRITATINHIEVIPHDRQASQVIRYNWHQGLRCKPATATIEPYDTGTSIKLIRIHPNGAERVELYYGPWY